MSTTTMSAASTTTTTTTISNAPTATTVTGGGPDPAVLAAIERGNAVVFLDVVLGEGPAEAPLGRIKLELFVHECPKTCENFRQFCTGEHLNPSNQQPMGYKNTIFHRVMKDFMIQGGDFVHHDGTGQASIYNTPTFSDENLSLKHDQPGVLSMANSGPDTNACQFFITCSSRADWLDGKHVVFGRVLDGPSMLVVRKCENVPVMAGNQHRPRIPIRVVECGEL